MDLAPDDIAQRCLESGVVDAADLEAARSAAATDDSALTAAALTESLVRGRRISEFQARRLLDGKPLLIDNYVIIDELGRGGMGVVYKARHRRMNREVAIKIISTFKLEAPDALARFQREIEALAKLSHPHIVGAYDADEVDGVHYLVMEYVAGRNLAEVVKDQGPMVLDAALDATLGAARGLEYAHRQGVIHRDVKPSNLLLTTAGIVKVLDLGLARLELGNEDARDGVEQTASGTIMGTADFMAPEQSLDARRADARSDVYSLGCTLHYLATGRPPYAGATFLERIVAHRERPIPSLRDALPSAQRQNPIAPAIEQLFVRMIAKEPRDRFQSMADVVAAIEHIRQGESTTAPSRVVHWTLAILASSLILLGLAALAPSPAWRGRTSVREQSDESPITPPREKDSVAPSAVETNVAEPKRDANREAAQWVQRCGGWVMVEEGRGLPARTLASHEPLPEAPFDVVGVGFNKRPIRDDELDVVLPLKRLSLCDLEGTGVGDGAVARLANLAALWRIGLADTQVTNEGLEPLLQLPGLRALDVTGTKVTVEGFERFKSLMPTNTMTMATLEGPESDLRVAHWLAEQRGSWTIFGYSAIDRGPMSVLIGAASFAGMNHVDSMGDKPWRISAVNVGIDTMEIDEARLKDLQDLAHLTEIDATRSQLEKEQVETLHGALPTCRIMSKYGTYEPASP